MQKVDVYYVYTIHYEKHVGSCGISQCSHGVATPSCSRDIFGFLPMFVFFLHLLTLSRLNYDDKKCLILMYIPLKNHYRFGLAQLGSQATGSPYKLCITLFLRVETTIESLHGQKNCSVWLQIFITSIISFTAQIGMQNQLGWLM